MKNLKVVFMGTPTFSVPVLKELIENCNVIMVVSQPDREKDRKGNYLETPTKKLALENHIEIYQPNKIKDEYQKIIDLQPDIIITCAYGQIIPEELLNYPKYGCINVHGSPLRVILSEAQNAIWLSVILQKGLTVITNCFFSQIKMIWMLKKSKMCFVNHLTNIDLKVFHVAKTRHRR